MDLQLIKDWIDLYDHMDLGGKNNGVNADQFCMSFGFLIDFDINIAWKTNVILPFGTFSNVAVTI